MKGKLIAVLVGIAMLMVGVMEVDAYQGKVSAYIQIDKSEYSVGDKTPARVMLNTGSSKISVAYVNLTYDAALVRVNKVIVNRSNFNGIYLEKAEGGVISLYAANSKSSAELPTGVVELGTVELEMVKSGTMTFNVKNFEVTGPSGSGDYSFDLAWQPKGLTIVSTVSDGTPVLRFRTSFAGVTAGAQCTDGWSVNVGIMSNGQIKNYDNVGLTKNGESNGLAVFEGEVRLSGVNSSSNLAVFIKGKKHLQLKYGVSGQKSFYNQSGGQILVTGDRATTPINDFSGYPLLAGDVSGSNEGMQDGVVDGLDFSYVKREVNKRTEGNGLVADLNGNCKLESQDLSLLMLAMKEKQEQLY